MADERDLLLESLETEVAVLMRRARRVIALRAAMVHPDLMPTSYVVLNLINERGPLRASHVAETFALDKGAVSRQVQHLTELGLVERSPDPDDRRASMLSVTDEGHERLAAVLASRRARLRERLDDWGDGQLAEFVDHLGHYNSALEWIDDVDVPVGGC